MNSLVGYDYSDDENDSSEESKPNVERSSNYKVSINAASSKCSENEKDDQKSLFKSVPLKKRGREEDNDEEELIVLPSQKEVSMREPLPMVMKNRIVITVPKFDDSDSEEEGSKKKKMGVLKPKEFKHGSSLFQYLPEAKVTLGFQEKKAKSMIPHSVLNRKNVNNNKNNNNISGNGNSSGSGNNNNKNNNSINNVTNTINSYNDDDDLLTIPSSSSSTSPLGITNPSTIPTTNFFSGYFGDDDDDDDDDDDLKDMNNKMNNKNNNNIAVPQASLYRVNYEDDDNNNNNNNNDNNDNNNNDNNDNNNNNNDDKYNVYSGEYDQSNVVNNNNSNHNNKNNNSNHNNNNNNSNLSLPLEQQYLMANSSNYSEEDLLRLQGSTNTRAEKLSAIHIIDVNLKDHLGDYEQERLKNSSREIDTTFYTSKHASNQPDAIDKRKHQMTYLAFQAKEREFELKNQWAENRFNKKQTQSKYGF